MANQLTKANNANTLKGYVSSMKGEIEKALNEFRASYILEHSLKDIYINEETLPGKISYTVNFIVTPKDKTLEASDIEKFSSRLIDHMKKINVELRS